MAPESQAGIAWRLARVEERLRSLESTVDEIPVLKNELKHLGTEMEHLGLALQRNTDSNNGLRNAVLVAALAFASAMVTFALTVAIT